MGYGERRIDGIEFLVGYDLEAWRAICVLLKDTQDALIEGRPKRSALQT